MQSLIPRKKSPQFYRSLIYDHQVWNRSVDRSPAGGTEIRSPLLVVRRGSHDPHDRRKVWLHRQCGQDTSHCVAKERFHRQGSSSRRTVNRKNERTALTNSRRKGKVGELKARDYLQSLGFGPCKRGQQRSGMEVADVLCDGLSSVHIEVKFGYDLSSFDLDRQLFLSAVEQAKRDSQGKRWVVLWKPLRKSQWRLSWISESWGIITAADDSAIQRALETLAHGH